MGQITSLLEDGSLFSSLGITDYHATKDPAMVCGTMGLNTDMKRILENFRVREGTNSDPRDCIIERLLWGSQQIFDTFSSKPLLKLKPYLLKL